MPQRNVGKNSSVVIGGVAVAADAGMGAGAGEAAAGDGEVRRVGAPAPAERATLALRSLPGNLC